MIETKRTGRHEHGIEDRYELDFGRCSIANGFAQIDTDQDASYFGTWANPFTLEVVNYAEGDLEETKLSNIVEFNEFIRECKRWNDEGHGRGFGIDPGFDENLRAAFVDAGLGDLLH